MSSRSRVTSPPTMRIARPGPGKGWRQTIRSGSPSSAPTARTSALNSIRNGSTTSDLRWSGRPPTLWRALLGAARADLALEQHPEWLDQLEFEVVGETAVVVVGLDRRRVVGAAGLDHV